MSRSVWIVGAGANEDEIRRGIAEAEAIFKRHKLTPEYCHAQTVAQADDDAYDERGVYTWEEAERVAIAECCAGWCAYQRLRTWNSRDAD